MTTDSELGTVFASALELLADRFAGQGEPMPLEHQGPWMDLAEQGVFAMLAPEHLDGLALGEDVLGPVFQTVGSRVIPGPVAETVALLSVVAPQGAADAIVPWADIADGSTIVSLADPGNDSGRWSRVTASDSVLAGRVVGVRSALASDFLVVIADSASGPVTVAVPTTADGVIVHSAHDLLDGSAPRSLVEFREVALDDCAILLSGKVAQAAVGELRRLIRVMFAHELCGATSNVAAQAREYALIREQFGRPIGSFQSIQHLLVDMHASSASLASLCGAEASEFRMRPDPWSRVLKGYASRVARDVMEGALQVHGGIGFTTELSLHRYFKRIMSLEPAYGSASDHDWEVGESVVNASLYRHD